MYAIRSYYGLNQGLQSGHKFILISAPAGYGKTTLVSAWAQQTDKRFAWLSLEESDFEQALSTEEREQA